MNLTSHALLLLMLKMSYVLTDSECGYLYLPPSTQQALHFSVSSSRDHSNAPSVIFPLAVFVIQRCITELVDTASLNKKPGNEALLHFMA